MVRLELIRSWKVEFNYSEDMVRLELIRSLKVEFNYSEDMVRLELIAENYLIQLDN